MQANSEECADKFIQVMGRMKWRVFVRTDNNESVYQSHYERYNASPASHMNLIVSDPPKNAFINSGYLSTFEFNGNTGLKATNSYLNFSKVHFIFIPEVLCDEIHLTGGTFGFEKIDEIAYPRQVIGTSWDIPMRHQYIPQTFNTEGMSIALKPGDARDNCEVLLGGNWQDYAVCVTLSKQQALVLAKSNHTDERALFADLKKYNPYFVVSQTLQQYEAKIRLGIIAKQLQEWWKEPDVERQLLCFLYAATRDKPYVEPTPEIDVGMLALLLDIAIKIEVLRERTPSLLDYLSVVQNLFIYTETQLISYSPGFYNTVLNFLKSQLKQLVFLHNLEEIDSLEIEKKIPRLKLLNEILIAEKNFWQCISDCDRFNFNPSELITIKGELLTLIKSSYADNSFLSEEKLDVKLGKISEASKQIKARLAEFLDRDYILNSGLQLLAHTKFSQAKGQSFIYCMGEWFNVWARRISGISFSPQVLHQQAKCCEQIKNNLILLQEFYDTYKNGQFVNKNFLNEFDKQVIDTINEVKSVLEPPSLDIGRYLSERTTQLVALMGTQITQRGGTFYIAPITRHLDCLNSIRKPESAVSVYRVK
ncbi:hypothetical protein [Legionella bozemanae]|uniref:Uncharacterized protein n=1 Tax=Legionella bozemanae TaxID=447 RepID=A0A0W0RW02_LEGBO|nr:hypothetical protein [Legionella bozemanae]KTC75276.1 hypothetical protein Lboz_0883 [Legionella bozemanae]STO35200.1 Uncharacterised protein [Legionella bozemanae]